MNLTVEQPSKIIELREIKLDESNTELYSSEISLNFYGMNSDMFEISKKKSLEGYVENEVLRDAIQMKIKSRTTQEECFGFRTYLLSSKFILESLKNDIRVGRFKVEDASVIVYFVTVNDAISFYHQYFSLVKMSFLRERLFETLIDNSEEQYSTGHNNRMTRIQYCAKVEQVRHSVSSENSLIYDFKPFISQVENEKEDNSNMTEDEFYSRIEFFNRMKGLYSKSEIKKLNTTQKNEECTTEEYEGRLDLIFMNAKELAVGSITNVIMQTKIKEMTEDQICELIRCFGNDISVICATKYGAYTIQTLILACSTEKTQSLICKYFGENGKYLFCHEIGNYSIQRILLFNEKYILGLIRSYLKTIMENKLGIKVLKRCLGLLKDRNGMLKDEIMKIKSKENAKTCEEILNLLN
ncbi:uncharacterized protein VICG_00434 [Vittaforma corneae ATCC 50505]|uniref:PUM-HD domain-containing protein n=1 Tax=Vittaforma corneae (strain ATCC 50505) TaxID=993615 RepID=L2GQU4_VITCO|nr:uncharacterized protein VICG_00434 [Vittaforma corneae ATCC 50505]ELA42682.1 hypothetical protein VICG_00434 [Vittaforma corneae ATCC 50505]